MSDINREERVAAMVEAGLTESEANFLEQTDPGIWDDAIDLQIFQDDQDYFEARVEYASDQGAMVDFEPLATMLGVVNPSEYVDASENSGNGWLVQRLPSGRVVAQSAG